MMRVLTANTIPKEQLYALSTLLWSRNDVDNWLICNNALYGPRTFSGDHDFTKTDYAAHAHCVEILKSLRKKLDNADEGT